MPRGKYVNHKGRNRNFTSPEELEAQRKKDEEEKKWKKTREGESDDDDEENEDGDDDSDESESEDDAKGAAQAVIQIENPNRVAKKSHRKVEEVEEDEAPQLTRREKEELDKQRQAAAYQKRHAEGKTAQAKADLARLAIIKQHRAEAAARRDAEKKEKEAKSRGDS